MQNGKLASSAAVEFDLETQSPVMPETVDQTGLSFSYLADLVLKAVYSDTNCTSERVAEKIKLPMGVAEPVLQYLYREKLIEVRERTSLQNNRYAMLDRGWERARQLLSICGYIGPAPVSLDAYAANVRHMEELRQQTKAEVVSNALSGLVLSDEVLSTLGLIVDSRRSLFLTGPPGSGKTSAAVALHNAQEGEVWVPYAIEVDGQVIRVFDLHNHQPVEQPTHRYDRRWVKIRPPLVVVGGEMTIESMDLIYSNTVRFYEAPFQMKSNGGVLLIDDFGRQRIDPHDLLNRWIIPLENRVDYLTLHTGKKIEVPFEQLLVFATNLDPKDLVDEAFLRRMGYRLAFTTPTVETYAKILQRYMKNKDLPYSPELLELLTARYRRENREMKSCDPRDLVERCLDILRYEKLPNVITKDLMERAWANYFGN
jgi:predicted ATPase with chaperone activity